PELLDARLVHESRVVVADLARVRSGNGGRGGGPDQLRGTLGVELGEHRPGAVAAAVRRNLGVLEPLAVGVPEEVVAGRDRAVDAGEVDPVGRRRCRDAEGRSRSGHRGGGCGEEQEGGAYGERGGSAGHGGSRMSAKGAESNPGVLRPGAAAALI